MNAFQKKTELIYYNRPDKSGPKISDYIKIEVDNAEEMKASFISQLHNSYFQNILSATNGKIGTVKKTRFLFRYGQTRIHIDDVEGLGTYAELEFCLHDDETLEDGTEAVHQIMEKLEISSRQLVEGAYLDAIMS